MIRRRSPRCFFDKRTMRSAGLERKGQIRVECPVCHARAWAPRGAEMIRRRSKPRQGPANIPADEWRNPAYRMFLREEGRCVICMKLGNLPKGWWVPCDPAHTENGGMRQKGPDSGAAPLCRRHHDEYDGKAPLPNRADGTPRERNHTAFEEFYGVDMKAEAAAWWGTFQTIFAKPYGRTILKKRR